MEFWVWLSSQWFDVVQTGVLVGLLLLLRKALVSEARIRQVGNSIKLTEHHRILWERLLADPDLGRILDPDAIIKRKPITPAEEMFVIFIILHLSDTYYASRTGFYQRPYGLRKDVQELFSLPVPRAIWERVKELQEPEFASFVEACLTVADSEREAA